jgi:ankyrin repeat protein
LLTNAMRLFALALAAILLLSPAALAQSSTNSTATPASAPEASSPSDPAFARALARWHPGTAPLTITLDRASCPAACPSYSITLNVTGSGPARITYSGRDHVLLTGTHTASIPSADAAKLVEQFRAANFASLAGNYTDSGDSAPARTVTLKIGAASKRVVDRANAPAALSQLEQSIATVTGLENWTTGNWSPSGTIAALQHEAWDFRAATSANAALLIAAANSGATDAVNTLLQLGVPPNQRDAAGHLPLFAAIEGNHADTVRALVAGHADTSLKSSDGESATDLATELGYDSIVQILAPSEPPQAPSGPTRPPHPE